MKPLTFFKTVILIALITVFSCSKDDSPTTTPAATSTTVEVLAGNNQTAIIETPVENPIEVLVKDQNGNPFAGASVTFSVQEGLPLLLTATSNTSGIATANWTLGSTVGTQTLIATVFMADDTTPLTGSPLTFNAVGTEIPCETLINPTELPIGPDGGTITTSIINVLDTFTISDINVKINITHTFAADLEMSLIAPDGTTMVALTSDNGGSGDNFINTVFDDDATLLILDTIDTDSPFSNTYQPIGSLADFNGLQSNGNWTLSILDDANGDGGELIDWSLEICGN